MLWYVHSLAVKWRALARRKEIREKAYTDALERVPNHEAQLAIDALIEMLRKANNSQVCPSSKLPFPSIVHVALPVVLLRSNLLKVKHVSKWLPPDL